MKAPTSRPSIEMSSARRVNEPASHIARSILFIVVMVGLLVLLLDYETAIIAGAVAFAVFGAWALIRKPGEDVMARDIADEKREGAFGTTTQQNAARPADSFSKPTAPTETLHTPRL